MNKYWLWMFLFFSLGFMSMQLPAEPLAKTSIQIGGAKAKVWASSELEPGSERYAVSNAFDGDPATAWVEGAEGAGDGSFLTIEFEEATALEGFILRPGYVKNKRVFTANSVPRTIEVQVDGNSFARYTIGYDLEFIVEPKGLQFEGCYHTDAAVNLEPRAVVFSAPVKGRTFRINVIEALAGSRYADLAISEWEPLLVDGNRSRAINPDVLQVLTSLRDERAFEQNLALRASIEDLRRKYIFNGRIHEGIPPADHAPHFFRVDPDLITTGEVPARRFVRHTKPALLNAVVMVKTHEQATYVVGARSFRNGDGDWLEFYPVINFDDEFRITSLREAVHADGAPGCHHVIPRDLSL